jgi:hypothetical protein
MTALDTKYPHPHVAKADTSKVIFYRLSPNDLKPNAELIRVVVADMFKKIDTNANGFIDQLEYIENQRKEYPERTMRDIQERMSALFKEFNVDFNTWTLNEIEVTKAVEATIKKATPNQLLGYKKYYGVK